MADDFKKNVMTHVVDFSKRRAQRLIEEGLNFFSEGKLSNALQSIIRSVDLFPTAEGYTHWAWVLGYQGRLDEAIELCKRAIEIDPEFGNPYNDIGMYYMKKGDLDPAVPWLERAKLAKRFQLKQSPYLNLGRIYLSQGFFLKALREFESALEHDPANEELRSVIAQIRLNYQKAQ